MRRPAWTRDTRIERLNRMVMSRLPHWTAEDVARHRAEGERMAARVAELSQPSDPLSHIHDFPCFAGQCPVDHQPSESAGAPRSDECCMDCYGPCQAAKPQPSEPQCQHRQHYEVVVKGCDCSGCWGEASTCTHQPTVQDHADGSGA